MLHAGIDLGGTKIEIRVLDNQGHQCYLHRVDTPQGDYQGTVDAIVTLVESAEAQLGATLTLGVGIPGAIDPVSGRIKNANSICLIGHPLDQHLQQRLDRPVAIANDADCLTLSESVDGAAAGARSVFGVILGTGVGGGISINQQVLTGPNAICGEWGHNPLPWADVQEHKFDCFCGHQGCIETFVSGPGLCRHYQRLSGNDVSRVEEVLARKAQGESEATLALDHYMEQLAKSLASVINILDPEVIVVGGGVSNLEAIYQDVPKRWQRYVLSNSVATRLVKAKFGDSSGARGAAWLGRG